MVIASINLQLRNGVRLASGADFTATDGVTVTLLTAANNGDTIEFQILMTLELQMQSKVLLHLKQFKVT